MPRQPRPNKIRISDLRTEEECIAYIEAESAFLLKHSASKHGSPVSPITVNICGGVIKSVCKQWRRIRLANRRAAEIAASDPNDEPATTVFVGQDGTVGISK